MEIITKIRGPALAADYATQTASAAARSQAQDRLTPSENVAKAARDTAAVQLLPKSAASDSQSLAARLISKTNAVADAEAARQAYIRASIAAGISPLPLT